LRFITKWAGYVARIYVNGNDYKILVRHPLQKRDHFEDIDIYEIILK
jgi:hypothetical protein